MSEKNGISKLVMIFVILIVLIIALASGYALVFQRGVSPTIGMSNTMDLQTISNLTHIHLSNVAQKNLTAIMSEYSNQYEAVWFYFNESSVLSALNGRHDCNPSGNLSCSYNVMSAWQMFFNGTGSLSSYEICGLNSTIELGGRALVSATLFFSDSVVKGQNRTMEVPYQVDFELVSGVWQLWKEYFGLPGEPVSFIQSGTSLSQTCD